MHDHILRSPATQAVVGRSFASAHSLAAEHVTHASQASLAGASAMLALLAAVAFGLAVGILSHRWRSALVAAAIAGGAFQLGHFGEHLVQASYWTTHRTDAPWMTPWASALAESFGRIAPGTPGFGMEALHLAGNAIFLAGAIAILAVIIRDGPAVSRRLSCVGVGVQTVHLLEHVALTATVLAGGRARGLSTLFGLLDPGPGLWTYRIWWHLTINAVATTAFAAGLIRWRRTTTAAGAARPALAG